MHKQFKKKLSLYWQLGRYDRPEGALLLFWPCIWGVLLSSNFSSIKIQYFFLFLIGSFVMRGAGCTINDIIDRNIDRKVQRTKSRPLALQKISMQMAISFLFFQLLLGLFVVLNLSTMGIFISFSIIPFILIYPFLKRFTYYPQALLGLVFNWGILVGYYEINQILDLKAFLLYFFGVLLTIGYDTIYGFQDLKDDIRINIKSLSIKIQNRPKTFLSSIYIGSLICLYFSLNISNFNNLITLAIIIFIIFHFVIQIKNFNTNDNSSLRKIFISNVSLGFVLSILMFINNIIITL